MLKIEQAGSICVWCVRWGGGVTVAPHHDGTAWLQLAHSLEQGSDGEEVCITSPGGHTVCKPKGCVVDP